jgi:Male sterility protein
MPLGCPRGVVRVCRATMDPEGNVGRLTGRALAAYALATDCWSMTVVMLTGASGFLGLHILQRLLDEGDQDRALVRRPEKLRENPRCWALTRTTRAFRWSQPT